MALSRRPEAVEILAEIRARGMEARASPDNAHVQYRPLVSMPIELARRLLAHRWEMMALLSADDPAVIWRVVALRSQVPEKGPIGRLLARPQSPTTGMAGCCATCGDVLDEGRRYRCIPCQHACWLVVGVPTVAMEIEARAGVAVGSVEVGRDMEGESGELQVASG